VEMNNNAIKKGVKDLMIMGLSKVKPAYDHMFNGRLSLYYRICKRHFFNGTIMHRQPGGYIGVLVLDKISAHELP
jgi:hypothetical protein